MMPLSDLRRRPLLRPVNVQLVALPYILWPFLLLAPGTVPAAPADALRGACSSGDWSACVLAGEEARRFGRLEDAGELLRRGCTGGDDTCCRRWRRLLLDTGGVTATRDTLGTECRKENAAACAALAHLEHEAGEDLEAEALAARACQDGSTYGCVRKALLLHENRGQTGEAREALRPLCAADHPYACGVLADLERGAGDLQATIDGLRAACDGGEHAACGEWALVVLWDLGLDGTREAIETACAHGSIDACRHLAFRVRSGGGIFEEISEQRLRCDSSELTACGYLGILLRKANRDTDAIAPLRKACDGALTDYCVELGGSLKDLRRPAEAIAPLRRARDAGRGAAFWTLSVILKKEGHQAESEETSILGCRRPCDECCKLVVQRLPLPNEEVKRILSQAMNACLEGRRLWCPMALWLSESSLFLSLYSDAERQGLIQGLALPEDCGTPGADCVTKTILPLVPEDKGPFETHVDVVFGVDVLEEGHTADAMEACQLGDDYKCRRYVESILDEENPSERSLHSLRRICQQSMEEWACKKLSTLLSGRGSAQAAIAANSEACAAGRYRCGHYLQFLVDHHQERAAREELRIRCGGGGLADCGPLFWFLTENLEALNVRELLKDPLSRGAPWAHAALAGSTHYQDTETSAYRKACEGDIYWACGELSERLQATGDSGAAVDAARRACEGDVRLCKGLGELLQVLERPEEALEPLLRTCRAGFSGICFKCSELLSSVGREEERLETDLLECRGSRASWKKACIYAAQRLESLGHHDDATRAWAELCGRASDEDLRGEACAFQAISMIQAGRPEDALVPLRAACAGSGDNPCGSLARILVKHGHDAFARQRFRRACEETGEPMSCARVGQFLDHAKQEEEAVPFHRIACDGGVPFACGTLGVRYYHSGKTEEANAAYRKACDGGEVWYCGNLASNLKREGSPAEEIEANYRKACDGDVIWACAHLGDWLRDQGRADDAVAPLSKGCDGGKLGACEVLGDILAALKRTEEAIDALRKGCPQKQGSERHRASCIALAAQLLETGHPDEVDVIADAICDESVGDCENLLEGMVHGGHHVVPHGVAKRFSERCDAGSIEACEVVGIARRVAGDADGALEAFGAACEAGSAEACGHFGHGLKGSEREEERSRAFRKGCEGGDLYSCELLGDELHRQERSADAEVVYQRACDGDRFSACKELGDVLRENDKLDGAAAAYQKACGNDRDIACRKAGEVLDELDRVEDAIEAYRAGCELNDQVSCENYVARVRRAGGVQNAVDLVVMYCRRDLLWPCVSAATLLDELDAETAAQEMYGRAILLCDDQCKSDKKLECARCGGLLAQAGRGEVLGEWEERCEDGNEQSCDTLETAYLFLVADSQLILLGILFGLLFGGLVYRKLRILRTVS